MALSFLSDLAGVGSFAVGVASLFDKEKRPEGLEDFRLAAQRNRDISDQLMNPNDPRFQALAGQEEDKIRGDLASALRELRTTDLRARARTGMGVLNPERRDESISQALSRGFSDAKERARMNARNYLQAAAAANSGAMSGFAGLTQVNQGINQQNTSNRASGFNAMFRGMDAMGRSPRLGGSSLLNGNPKGTPAERPTISETDYDRYYR
jgi:hypothetical protein